MRDYKDARAARSAIEDRIRQKAEKDGSDISTIRRKIAFDALLERISADGTFVLKGGLLLSGYFVPLALVILTPIVINIVLVHAFLAPSGLPLGLIIAFLLAYLTFFAKPYSNVIKSLFRR